MQRVTVSMDETLSLTLDRLVEAKGYASRSEAVRDILRRGVSDWTAGADADGHCAAILSFVCDRSVRGMPHRLAHLTHEHHDLVTAAQSVPLGHDHSLETIVLKGQTRQVQNFAAQLSSERGISFEALNIISVEPNDHHSHDDAHAHDGHLHLDPIVQ